MDKFTRISVIVGLSIAVIFGTTQFLGIKMPEKRMVYKVKADIFSNSGKSKYFFEKEPVITIINTKDGNYLYVLNDGNTVVKIKDNSTVDFEIYPVNKRFFK
jgi:hypothetical protein